MVAKMAGLMVHNWVGGLAVALAEQSVAESAFLMVEHLAASMAG